MPPRGQRSSSRAAAAGRGAVLRIIGGEHRGRGIRFNGDPATRPMKERVREAVFNLIGPAVKGKLVVDLFAGTGAMALEALSRGADRAVLVERSFPNARVIQQNAEHLGVSERVTVVAADAFFWSRRTPDLDADMARLTFCCPPYAYYETRTQEMLDLVCSLLQTTPEGSLVVIECDNRFDTAALPRAERWDVRRYPPAIVAVYEVES